MEDENLTPTPQVIGAVPPLPSIYDVEDERINAILNQVSTFCGKEFTVVPPNPDGEKDPETGQLEGGVPVPLAEEGEGSEEPSEGSEEPSEENEGSAEKYPEGTGEEPNPDLDSLRIAYQAALLANTQEKTTYWAILWQVIRLISTMACWTESFDDTFILQWRKQIYEAKQANPCTKQCCNCDADQIVIPIDYAPLQFHPDQDKNGYEQEQDAKPFIGGVISVVINGQRQETKISADYLNEHYDPYTQKLYIMREDFAEVLYGSKSTCCCLCERELNIVLYYNAGYYSIPEGILPLVCQLMGKIEDSKKPLSDCSAALTQVSGLLKSMKSGNIQYTWSDNDEKLGNTQNLFAEIYNIASMAEIFSLSRCVLINKEVAGEVI